MFDALQDTPRDFQFKLMDALNSLSQTMGVAPEDAFNQVLCASNDENPDVKKKLYNWWRAFFEVLGKLTGGKMPKDVVSEYNGKIDDLMAEIMKSGDASSESGDVVAESRNPNNSIRFGRGDIVDWDDPDTGERHRGWRVGSVNLDEFELFPPEGGKSVWVNEYYMDKVRKYNEDYEEADKADEDEMNKDFEFAVQHIGEIANKVKDIVNFVNPYCESGNEEDTSMKAKALTKEELVKLVGGTNTDEMEVYDWRAVKDMDIVEFDVFVKNTGQLGNEPATSVADIVDVAKEVVGEVVSKSGWDFDVVPVDEDITVQMWNGDDFDGKVDVYNDQTRLGDSDGAMFKVVCGKYDMNDNSIMKDNITNERRDSDWVSMDDMIGMEVGESDSEEYMESEDDDTLGEAGEEIVIANAKKTAKKDGYDQYILFDKSDNSWAFERKHIQTKDDFAKFGQEVVGIVRSEDLKFVPFALESDDGLQEIGQQVPMKEATVMVDANDVWDVLDLLDDPDANKNLTNLINSHVRTEAEIMDAIDSRFGEESPTKVELNDAIRDFWWIVSALDLDVEQFKKDGSFVDPEKPVALESDDDLLKVGDKVKVVGKGLASKGWVGEISSVDKAKKGLPYTVTFADRDPGEYAKDEVELVQEKDETPPDEVKDGEKKYKQDGETKTLDFGENKKPVCEMTIEQEIDNPWNLLELLWGQGRDNFRDLLESELIDDDTLMMMLEDMEIKNLTSINDAFAYDFPTMLDMLGLDGEAWSQNLVIKRKED